MIQIFFDFFLHFSNLHTSIRVKNAIKIFSADFPLYDGLGLFLLKKFLNGPIRKVIMLKVKFEDLETSLLPGYPISFSFQFNFKFNAKYFSK